MLRRLFGWQINVPLPGRRLAVPVILAAFLLCCCSTIGLFVLDVGLRQAGVLPTYTPRPPATPRPAATMTPAVTAIPRATTVAAKSSPTVAVTAAESAYLAAILNILGDLSQAMTALGEHSTAAGANPQLLLDDDWKLKAAVYLATIQVDGDRIRALTPPLRYADVHAELLTAVGHYDNTAKFYAQGVDEINSTKLDQGIQSMQLGNAAIQRAAQKLPGAAQTAPPTSPAGPRANTAANLRAGPGTNYDKIGSAASGQVLDIIARNPAGDWYQLRGGAWISADLVTAAPVVPVAAAIPTVPPALPTVTVAPASQPAATAVAGAGGANPNAFTCIGGCTVAPDPSCAIKGNVNTDHEKIYHTPGQRDYNKTNIIPAEGDRWFCTAAEALAAGFRPAQQ